MMLDGARTNVVWLEEESVPFVIVAWCTLAAKKTDIDLCVGIHHLFVTLRAAALLFGDGTSPYGASETCKPCEFDAEMLLGGLCLVAV